MENITKKGVWYQYQIPNGFVRSKKKTELSQFVKTYKGYLNELENQVSRLAAEISNYYFPMYWQKAISLDRYIDFVFTRRPYRPNNGEKSRYIKNLIINFDAFLNSFIRELHQTTDTRTKSMCVLIKSDLHHIYKRINEPYEVLTSGLVLYPNISCQAETNKGLLQYTESQKRPLNTLQDLQRKRTIISDSLGGSRL